MAAHGGDELLHAVLGAAVAGGARLVHQSGVLLARPHAHAGALTLHSTNTHVTTCQEVIVAACIVTCCVRCLDSCWPVGWSMHISKCACSM